MNIQKIGLNIWFILVCFQSIAQIPSIVFTQNKNQWDDRVLYRSQLYQGFLYAEKQGFTYYFTDGTHKRHSHSVAHGEVEHEYDEQNLKQQLSDFVNGTVSVDTSTIQPLSSCNSHEKKEFKAHAYAVQFINMNKKASIVAHKPISGIENYYIGNNPQKWAQGVQSFETITYKGVYSNIDLSLYNNNGSLKYDFIVKPGGKPSQIQLRYTGVPKMEIDINGNLIIYTSVNEVFEKKPIAYQIIENDTIFVECAYKLEYFTLSYTVGIYNPKYTLYIDPELVFSTYTGSIADNWGFTATYDSENNVYAGGIVDAFGYPTNIGALQETFGGGTWDVGIIKYDPTGTQRLYATYLGGTSAEMPHSLIANSNNELLILGTTGSHDFPMQNAYDPTFNGGKNILYDNAIEFENGVDMFIARLSSNGTQLLSSTYLGGSANDGINFDWEVNLYYGHDSLYYNYGDGARGEIMIDDDNNVYIASTTFSNDFPVVQAMQPTFGGMQDGIVCKFTPDLSVLQWSTYVGGSSKDAAYSIDVDHSGNAYVTGGTCSSTLGIPMNGFIKNRIGGTVDAFVLKMSQSNGALQAATYYGSTAYDQAHFVRVNNVGNVFIFGQTRASGNTLIYNAPFNRPNSGQFLASFSNDLQTLNWSTVFGTGNGRPNISPTAFEVDICNRIYLAGSGRDWAQGQNPGWFFDPYYGYYRYDAYGWRFLQGTKNLPITADAYQSYTDGQDFYIMVIDDEAKNLDYATFIGEINYGGWISYDGVNVINIPCNYSGHDHVDGGTSRFDNKGYIYQSVCASCGACNGFPTSPKPGAWSNNNNSTNCNNAVMRFFIDFGLLIADFELPEIGCKTKELEFKNTTKIHYNNPQITYTWNFGDGSPVSHDENPKHVYVNPGEYIITLTVADNSACNLSDSIKKKLVIVNNIKNEILPDKNICEGQSTIIGISNPYNPELTYEWNPTHNLTEIDKPQSTANPTETTQYTLTVSSGWCQTVYNQMVNVYKDDYTILSIQSTVLNTPKNPVCVGDQVRLTAQTSSPTQRYLWSTSPYFFPILNSDFKQNSIVVNPTETTMYYVHTLSMFCEYEDIDSILVEVADNKIIATGDTLICKNDVATISVQNLINGSSLSYNWTPKSAVVSGGDSENAIVRPERSTQFIVYATNYAGCIVQDTVQVNVDEVKIETSVYNPISCHGQTDASIVLSPKGIEPYTYEWENGLNSSQRSQLGEGKYIVTVTDGLGCINTREFVIEEPDLLQIIDTSIWYVTCDAACNGAIDITISGGTLPYAYLWSRGDTTKTIQSLCQGLYNVNVTDAHGCKTSLAQAVIIGKHERLPYLDAFAEQSILFKGQSTQLHASPIPIDTVSYFWYPNIWMENYALPIVTVVPQDSFTYYVRAIDTYGCESVDTVQVTVHEWVCDDPFIYIPTAFTPNNDGKNDMLYIKSYVITDLYFAIYDRWGEKLFETTDITKGWDGTYQGKVLQPQVLVYYLEATCLNQQKFKSKGNITIIK
jgi:gliding motility-associated-like protein